MFKSRISLPTARLLKILLSLSLTTVCFGCSIESEAVTAKSRSDKAMAAATLSEGELMNLAKSVHQQINQYRNSLNLAPLTLKMQISQQAKIHSQNMAQQKVDFSHKGFDSRIKALSNDISYRSAAENVAYNMGYGDPVTKAVEGWLKSKGHRQNIEGNYNLTGIGVAKNQQGEYYFTQIFILEK